MTTTTAGYGQTVDGQMQYILDEFDFDKIQKVMLGLDWRWSSTKGVPLVGDLRRCVRELFRLSLEDGGENFRIATGGFVLDRHDGIFRLHFEVSSADAMELFPERWG